MGQLRSSNTNILSFKEIYVYIRMSVPETMPRRKSMLK